MTSKNSLHLKMRVIHRYLGFFLAGIMAVYALSGIVLIFRNTDLFKQERKIEKDLALNLAQSELAKALNMKSLKIEKEEGSLYLFEGGSYDKTTGKAVYTEKKLPLILDKMTHLHKAKSSEPLYFLNIFFGLSLFFFVISSFWMFLPHTSVFKKGLYFTLGGMLLTFLLLFI